MPEGYTPIKSVEKPKPIFNDDETKAWQEKKFFLRRPLLVKELKG